MEVARLRPLRLRLQPEQMPLIHTFLFDAKTVLDMFYVNCSEVARDAYSLSRQPVFYIDAHLCSEMERVLARSYHSARKIHVETMKDLSRCVKQFIATASSVNVVSSALTAERILALVERMRTAPVFLHGDRAITAHSFQPLELP